eukprot:Sspe_Gene.49097::Locus_26117_Transcript_1_1_Confidence_1.000_Length_1288::g.49097::m.49097
MPKSFDLLSLIALADAIPLSTLRSSSVSCGSMSSSALRIIANSSRCSKSHVEMCCCAASKTSISSHVTFACSSFVMPRSSKCSCCFSWSIFLLRSAAFFSCSWYLFRNVFSSSAHRAYTSSSMRDFSRADLRSSWSRLFCSWALCIALLIVVRFPCFCCSSSCAFFSSLSTLASNFRSMSSCSAERNSRVSFARFSRKSASLSSSSWHTSSRIARRLTISPSLSCRLPAPVSMVMEVSRRRSNRASFRFCIVTHCCICLSSAAHSIFWSLTAFAFSRASWCCLDGATRRMLMSRSIGREGRFRVLFPRTSGLATSASVPVETTES